MGGSMYQAANDYSVSEDARRARSSRAEEFGQFAYGFSATAPSPLSISGPSEVETGLVVDARFDHPPIEGETSPPTEWLVTLKPVLNHPLGAGQLIDLLAKELVRFGLGQMVATNPTELLRALASASAQPTSIAINGVATVGWSLELPEVRGLVAGSHGRVFMWLATRVPSAPTLLVTKDLSSYVRALLGT
jgi:hypothetical protein